MYTDKMEAKICLIGYGNVGESLIKLLIEKNNFFKKKLNLEIKVIAIFESDGALIDQNGLNLVEIIRKGKEFRNLVYWRKNRLFNDVVSNLDVDIIVETTPTNTKTGEPGLSHIIAALNNNIDVVSSNKGPFYLAYDKILKLAKEKACYVKFEATVASCVPIVSIKKNLIGNYITGIKAILNGTSNYILSRMTAESIDFSTALKEAQELGYAEAQPYLDIDGYDAAGKLVILANQLMGWSRSIKDVKIKGISKITPHAIELAKSEGLVIKPLAVAENDKLIVEPRLIEKDSPLNINGTLNVIELNTEYAGPIVFIGRGAGGYEAASAIINDLLTILKIKYT
ncbi:MAG: homoserine dehydrogenase [Candidatus Hodarchaeota archaeon]